MEKRNEKEHPKMNHDVCFVSFYSYYFYRKSNRIL